MTGEPPPAALAPDTAPSNPAPRRGGGTFWIAAIAFLIGIAAVVLAWPAIQRWRGIDTTPNLQAPIVVTPSAAATSAGTPPITIEGLAAREAAIDLQLRTIEARLSYADSASRTAAADAMRAERLMVAFAARRRIDRGLPLGLYEALLRSSFGSDAPRPVDVVISSARAPVTLGDLREALDTIAPKLTSGSAKNGIGQAVWRELTGLVILRRETQPSTRAVDRLERARRSLDAGQVEAAIAEVARMPGAAEARSWLDAAASYVRARDALGALEVIALARPAVRPTAAPPAPVAAANPAQ